MHALGNRQITPPRTTSARSVPILVIHQILNLCAGLRQWQTPSRGTAGWSDGFQDYRELTGYADFLYAADRKSALVTVNAFSRTGSALTYAFNGGAFGSANKASVNSAFTGAYVIAVKDAGGHVLNLDRASLPHRAGTVESGCYLFLFIP
jgi:hypothetical protein